MGDTFTTNLKEKTDRFFEDSFAQLRDSLAG